MTERVSAGDPEDQTSEDTTEGEALLACAYETCPRPKCTDGAPLMNPACDPCVEKVCAVESSCCGYYWDPSCIDLVESLCGVSCGGGYLIQSKSTGQCLSTTSTIYNNSLVQQAGCSDAANQRFALIPYGGYNTYNIVAVGTGLCIGVDYLDHTQLEPIISQNDCYYSGPVYVVSVGAGYYMLIEREYGRCFEALGPGGELHQTECDGGSNQKFRFYAKG
jgi:hypothetical protein